jgi:hypothetical protein
MLVFGAGAGMLALSFVVHVIVWRVRLPGRQIETLLVIFALVPAAALLGVYYSGLPMPRLFSPETLRLALFYIPFSLAYICIYSAIEIPSPTLTIVSYLARCRPSGCTEQQISDLLNKTDGLSTRLGAMRSGDLIALDNGRCRLTSKGRRIARLFEFASVIFGLPLGG